MSFRGISALDSLIIAQREESRARRKTVRLRKKGEKARTEPEIAGPEKQEKVENRWFRGNREKIKDPRVLRVVEIPKEEQQGGRRQRRHVDVLERERIRIKVSV